MRAHNLRAYLEKHCRVAWQAACATGASWHKVQVYVVKGCATAVLWWPSLDWQ